MANDGLTIAVIAGFVAGIVLIASFVVESGNIAIAIPTLPKISEHQVIVIIEQDLKSKVSDFQNITLFNTCLYYNICQRQDREYIPVSEFEAKNLPIPLFYQHPNGTLFGVDPLTHDITRKCDNLGGNTACSVPSASYSYGIDRLFYGVDIQWNAKSRSQQQVYDYYLVDAQTGEILWAADDHLAFNIYAGNYHYPPNPIIQSAESYPKLN